MSDNKIEGLIARLEAAVEKMEKSQGGDKFANLVNSLEKSVLKLESLHGGNQAPETKTAETVKPAETQAQTSTPKPAVPEVDRFHPFDEQYNEWFEKAKSSGNQDLIAMTEIGYNTFVWADAVVSMASISKRPSDDIFGKIAQYIRDRAKEIDDKFIRPRKCENEAKTLKEGLGACFWFLTDAPVQYLDGVIEPTVYNANKVRLQKKQAETEWVEKFIALLKKMKDYIKEHYITGLIWKGKTVADFTSILTGQIPLTPAIHKDDLPEEKKASNDRAAMFAELNKGSAITEGLKVAERKPKGQVSTGEPLQPKTVATTTTAEQAKPKAPKAPKKYLKDNWFVENFTDDRTLVIDEAEMGQSVFIDNCHKCCVQVKGKVKSIIISNCSHLGVVFDNVVSTVEAVNTKTLTIQAKIHAPSVVLDKCERVKVYLAKNLETDIVSSMVSELNISYLLDDDDNYAKDYPVTEQFLTRFDPKLNRFVTKPQDIFM
jgi:adenylyl cyclase-associated protein